jgi:hypothetical protein
LGSDSAPPSLPARGVVWCIASWKQGGVSEEGWVKGRERERRVGGRPVRAVRGPAGLPQPLLQELDAALGGGQRQRVLVALRLQLPFQLLHRATPDRHTHETVTTHVVKYDECGKQCMARDATART